MISLAFLLIVWSLCRVFAQKRPVPKATCCGSRLKAILDAELEAPGYPGLTFGLEPLETPYALQPKEYPARVKPGYPRVRELSGSDRPNPAV